MGTENKVSRILERQKKLEEQQKSLVSALSANLELQKLDGIAAEELPRLWSQLHELRQAFELLRAAAAPQNPQELAGLSADWFSKVEHLQRTWTDTTADSLREQARKAEALLWQPLVWQHLPEWPRGLELDPVDGVFR